MKQPSDSFFILVKKCWQKEALWLVRSRVLQRLQPIREHCTLLKKTKQNALINDDNACFYTYKNNNLQINLLNHILNTLSVSGWLLHNIWGPLCQYFKYWPILAIDIDHFTNFILLKAQTTIEKKNIKMNCTKCTMSLMSHIIK